MGKKGSGSGSDAGAAPARDPYPELVSAAEQFSSDVSLFRELVSEQGGSLNDSRHEDLVSLAEEMQGRLSEFLKLGRAFSDTNVRPDALHKMLDALGEMTQLMLPPKVMGGYLFCCGPCLKPKRSGADYDRRFYSVESKIILTSFLSHALVLSQEAEVLLDDSTDFSNTAKKMNVVFNSVSEIKTQGNDKIREKAKNELAAACDTVNRFVGMYFRDEDAEHAEFKSDATRRILQTNELLMSRSHADGAPGVEGGGGGASPRAPGAPGAPGAISRRILVKAQSSLQEIMNSAAAICLGTAKSAQRKLEDLGERLHNSYDKANAALGALRKRMKEHTLGDLLKQQKDDCENALSDTERKIEDAEKRWSTVAAQSKTRPVAEYDEADDLPEGRRGGTGQGIVVADLKDPQKLMAKTGKTMQKVGTGGKAVMKDVLKTAVGIGQLIGEDLRSLTGVGGGSSSSDASPPTKSKGPGGGKRPPRPPQQG